MNRLRLALALALIVVLAWTVPMSANDLDLHGDANTYYTIDPVCTRTGDLVTVAIANPTVWPIYSLSSWTYVAFYLKGYNTGKGVLATTNGNYWYASKGDFVHPSYLYNFGNGVWAPSTAISMSGTTPDYWSVYTYVLWPDGYGEWVDTAQSPWCYA